MEGLAIARNMDVTDLMSNSARPDSVPALAVLSASKAAGFARYASQDFPIFLNSSSNGSRAHSMQWSVKCGKLRNVHMGTPPPSAALPPSR